MDRDFNWLWEQYKEGARGKFEEVCYQVYSNEYPNDTVKRVRVEQGDGGIDVYISHSNGDFTVVQCKFFRYEVGKSQKAQIRESFKSAVANQYEMTKWILCIPILMSNTEHKWWLKWKKEKEAEFNIEIQLDDADTLMKLIKKHNLYEEYFETVRIDTNFIKDVITKDEKTKIHDRLYPLIGAIAEGDYYIHEVISRVDQLMDLKAHRLFKGSHLIEYLDQLSDIFAFHADGNTIRDPDMDQKVFELRKAIIAEYQKIDFGA